MRWPRKIHIVTLDGFSPGDVGEPHTCSPGASTAAEDEHERAAREWSRRLREDCKANFRGGYSDGYDIFVHGMDTVCNVLDDSLAALLRAQRDEARTQEREAIGDGYWLHNRKALELLECAAGTSGVGLAGEIERALSRAADEAHNAALDDVRKEFAARRRNGQDVPAYVFDVLRSRVRAPRGGSGAK